MDANKRKDDRQSRAPELVILCLSAIIVGAIGTLSYLRSTTAKVASADASRAHNVADLDRQLLSAVKDAETGQRGYLVTGRHEYLEPYNQALPLISGLTNRLEAVTRSTPEESQRVRAIETLVSAKLAELKETIDLRRSR